jgi:hypothetical protein
MICTFQWQIAILRKHSHTTLTYTRHNTIQHRDLILLDWNLQSKCLCVYIYIYIYIYIITYNINSGATMNFIQQYVSITITYSNHIFIFIAAIIYFEHCICKFDVLILYSFVLMSPWGWWFITEICRTVHVYGWYVMLYKLRAFVGVGGQLFSFVYVLFFPL